MSNSYNYRECVDLVKSALKHIKAGASADKALVKMARENDLPSEVLRRCAHAYNTAKTLNFFDKEAHFKGAAFKLLDPADVVSQYEEEGTAKAASAKQAHVVDEAYDWKSRYPGIDEMNKAASAEVADKFVVKPTLEAKAKPTYDFSKQSRILKDITTCQGTVYDMASEITTHLKRAFDETKRLGGNAVLNDLEARALHDCGDYEKRAFSRLRELYSAPSFGHTALAKESPEPFKGLVRPEHLKLAECVEKVAEAMEIRDMALIELAEQRELAKEAGIGGVEAEEPRTDKDNGGGNGDGGDGEPDTSTEVSNGTTAVVPFIDRAPQGRRRPEPVPVEAEVSDVVPGDRRPARMTSAVAAGATKERPINDALKSIASGANAGYQGAGNIAKTSPFSDLTNKLLESIGTGDQRKVDTEMSRTKVKLAIERLMTLDPAIKQADPDLVVSLANSIHSANPTFAQDYNSLKGMLREMLQFESMPASTFTDLAKTHAATSRPADAKPSPLKPSVK